MKENRSSRQISLPSVGTIGGSHGPSRPSWPEQALRWRRVAYLQSTPARQVKNDPGHLKLV
jgi:hypothetical protein